MEKLRKICEITAFTLSDINWVLKLLENQDVFVRRFDTGSGREQFIIYEKNPIIIYEKTNKTILL